MSEGLSQYRQLPFGLIEKRPDSILVFRPNPDILSPSIEQLMEMYAAFMEIQQGAKSPVLSDNRFVLKSSGVEKEYVHRTTPDFASHLAFLVSSPLNTFIHNAFLYLYQPVVPIKLFTEEEKALDWLKSHL